MVCLGSDINCCTGTVVNHLQFLPSVYFLIILVTFVVVCGVCTNSTAVRRCVRKLDQTIACAVIRRARTCYPGADGSSLQHLTWETEI